MRLDAKDMARLWDMLDAARATMSFLEERDLEDMLSDRMLRAAVERNLEIIGEAARHVSQQTRSALPEVPWKAIVGLRNIIAHEYGEIRYEKVWAVCANRLPELIRLRGDRCTGWPPRETSVERVDKRSPENPLL